MGPPRTNLGSALATTTHRYIAAVKPPSSRASKWRARGRAVPLILRSLAACSHRDGRPAVAEVVLVGDSIALETAPYLQRLLGDTRLLERYLGGTAPCDWLDKDLQATRRRVVVISFTGNSLTPCSGAFRFAGAIADAIKAL